MYLPRLPGPTRRCQRGGQKYRARSDIDEKGYDERGLLFVLTRSILTRRWHEEEVFDRQGGNDEKVGKEGRYTG
jgi:hypothetical protein